MRRSTEIPTMLHKLAKTARPASANVGAMTYARLLLAACLVACGGGSSGGGGGAIDAPKIIDGAKQIDADPGSYDFECGGSTPCKLDKVCCTNPGPPIAFSCTDKTSCAAPDQISCDGPDDCSNGDVCCGVDVPDGSGSFPNCGATSIGATCMPAASCKTTVQQNCTKTSKVQLCHTPADCNIEPANDQCCTFGTDAASLTFCIDSTTAQFGNGVCH
jgi:hypothetical protein